MDATTERVTDEYAKTVCRTGQGHACCRYIGVGPNGWSCLKHTQHREYLDNRVKLTKLGIAGEYAIVAQGDNCEGRAA